MRLNKLIAGGLLVLASLAFAALLIFGGPAGFAGGTNSIWTLVGMASVDVLVFLIGVYVLAR